MCKIEKKMQKKIVFSYNASVIIWLIGKLEEKK